MSVTEVVRSLRLAAVLVAVALGILVMPVDVLSQSGTPAYAAYTAAEGPAASFAPDARVNLFSAVNRRWVIAKFSETKPGDEFYFNNQLYRVVDSKSAQCFLATGTDKLFEAGRPYEAANCRKPTAWDVVQVLDKDSMPSGHALLSSVQAGANVRFQGKVYSLEPEGALKETGLVIAPGTYSLRRIRITASGWQHVVDRHTSGGKLNAGKSVFSSLQEIQPLIKNAEIIVPVEESNGYLKREFEAGRAIGYDGYSKRQVTTIRVITTKTGDLVTAYPVSN